MCESLRIDAETGSERINLMTDERMERKADRGTILVVWLNGRIQWIARPTQTAASTLQKDDQDHERVLAERKRECF